MEKICIETRMFCAYIAQKDACFHVFSQFSAHLPPPPPPPPQSHHSGKWSID